MKDLEKKANYYEKSLTNDYVENTYIDKLIQQSYKDGYEQGQKDFDTDVTKLLNSYGVKFIDTNSIGGLIALHQLMLDLEKENEELKAQIIQERDLHTEASKNYLQTIKELKTQTEEQAKEIADLRNTLCSALKTIKENKDKWKYLEGRFVEVNECSEEQRLRCPMYEDMYCDGTNCKSFIDLVALLESACEKR